jgi:hypothetical protein
MIILMQLLITVLAISMYVIAIVAIYDEWIN